MSTLFTMLLERRWREVVEDHANAWALSEMRTDRRWTFRQLADLADSDTMTVGSLGSVDFPEGHNCGFIVAVLRAWRRGRVVCPLEPGQGPPGFHDPSPLAGVIHLKMTSGTTGTPRCVAFTAAQLAADAAAIVATMGLKPEFPNLGIISLAHSYGFSNLVLPLLLYGIPLVLVPSTLPAALAKAVETYPNVRFTLPAVPALWRAWHEAGVIPRHLHRAISAGAPLTLPLEQAVFRTSGVKLHNFLGASECGGIAYDASETPRTDPRFAGTPLLEVELTRADNGCLEVRSPAVGQGYWPTADPALGSGRYRTLDLVELGPGSEVFLLGRAADVINVAGRKVSPETIELALRSHPEIRDCLVVGLPAADSRGEMIAAVFEAGLPLSGETLRTFLQLRLLDWQIPRRWEQVESLQPNGRGKLSRREWRERLA